MTDAAKGYLVRDAETAGGKGRKVDQIYPYTLRGLTEALEEARFRSHSGAPQVLAILGTGNIRVIRRFEDGREVPAAPLPALLPACPVRAPAGRPQLGADRADGRDRRGQPRGQVLAVARDQDRAPDRVDPRDRQPGDRAVVPDGVSSGAMVTPHPMPTRLMAVPTSCTVAATRGWKPAATHMLRTRRPSEVSGHRTHGSPASCAIAHWTPPPAGGPGARTAGAGRARAPTRAGPAVAVARALP